MKATCRLSCHIRLLLAALVLWKFRSDAFQHPSNELSLKATRFEHFQRPAKTTLSFRRLRSTFDVKYFKTCCQEKHFRLRRVRHVFGSLQEVDSTEIQKDSVGPENELQLTASGRAVGVLVLLTVPLSWGTYGPTVRYLYELQPPVPGFVFSAAYYTLAAGTLLSFVSWQNFNTKGLFERNSPHDDEYLDASDSFPIIGGIELGLYLFVANCLQVVGLQSVASDRAGFLVQLTTVMVPFAEALFAGTLLVIPTRTWGACILAFAGICVMGLDGKISTSPNIDSSRPLSIFAGAFSSFTQGDLLIICAAVLYTLHVVRLGRYAKETTPIRLAATKATTEAFLSVALVAGLAVLKAETDMASSDLVTFAIDMGKDINVFFASFTSAVASETIPKSALLTAIGATLWTGWITCAYTIYAQSFGQSRVSPTNANLIYTFQPIFTALFAWALLGETMGPIGFLGGGMIGTAAYVVLSSNK